MACMISSNRASTSSLGHESRMAFWLISRPEVATPPALLALPGANRMPACSKRFTASAVDGMLAPSATQITPFLISGSILFIQFILRRARQGDVHRHVPGAKRARIWPLRVRHIADPGIQAILYIHQLSQFFRGETFLINDCTAGVRDGDHFGAERHRFLHRILRNVP